MAATMTAAVRSTWWLRCISTQRQRSLQTQVQQGHVQTQTQGHVQTQPQAEVEVGAHAYPADSWTNVPARILAHVNRNLHLQRGHPLQLVCSAALGHFRREYTNVKGAPLFSVADRLSPVVTVRQNFDSLLVPAEHPSRRRSDCFYLNERHMLRAHTTAHLADLLRSGLRSCITVGDVYRRDAVDSTHFPVFHQLDAFRSLTKDQLFPDRPDLDVFRRIPPPPGERGSDARQDCHTHEAVKVVEYQLKGALVGLVKRLFGENIDYRWVDAHFPFTRPSWELEIFYDGEWMEALGCGVVEHEILKNAGVNDSIAYAFGIGLERIAMALYDIPDIRLFWSRDSGFLSQFAAAEPGRVLKYRPISVYPQCVNDMSFWLPEGISREEFSDNDFYDLVRETGGDVVEQVELVDSFTHPKTDRTSRCYRIVYRHMERTLKKNEVAEIHRKIKEAAEHTLKVTVR